MDQPLDARNLIVIGASAGGVYAILELASALPPDFPAPIFFVQHVGAYPSRLPELVSAKGPNRAVAPQDGEVPAPGTIYIAPPDHHMLLEGGAIRLWRGPKEHHARPAVDPLFRSAALCCGPRAVGVILTGMLDDGSAGLRAIKECGGIAVVQDPDDAMESSMPRSALTHVAADYVVPLADMAGLLHRLAVRPLRAPDRKVPSFLRDEHAASMGDHSMEKLQAIGAPSVFSCPDCGGVLFELDDKHPPRYRCHTGHAFSLRSLAHTQEQVTDAALWAGLRALQEKEAMLRRMAAAQSTQSTQSGSGGAEGDGRDALAEADELAEVSAALRRLTEKAPSPR